MNVMNGHNGKVKNVLDNRVCTICRDPKTPKLEIAFSDHTITTKEICETLEVQPNQWYKHINYHLMPQVYDTLATNREVLAAKIVDQVDKTIEALDRLEKNVKRAEKMLGTAPDPTMIKAYTTLEEQNRKTLEYLAKLQGEFKDQSIIKANNVTVEYNTVIGTVLEEACPNCKLKFAKSLPNIIKKVDNAD